MPTYSTNKTYADGNVLTEQDLDNIKDSIETFLNVTKLDDDNLQDDGISSDKFTPATRALFVLTGTVLDYAGTSAPSGYLLCYGQQVSQTTYADLFTVISTTYNTGGESVGNFRIPDLRGRAAFGNDNMGGSDANRISTSGSGIDGNTTGAAGGAESTTLTTTELPAHTHGMNSHTHSFSATTSTDGAHSHNTTNIVLRKTGTGVGTQAGTDGRFDQQDTTSSDGNHTHTVSGTSGAAAGNTTSSGTGSAFSKMPPALILNKIIKT